ncbi:MAG: Holliday junction resolvase RuvX, partial [Enterococcus sp.]|nr:Holliday junction resolvase RuvX [Enterococcus sp.]
TVVVGLPLSLMGKDSEQTKKTRSFFDMLNNKLKSNGLSNVRMVWQDERFSSREAERALNQSDMRGRKNKKKVIDKVAATIILESYLMTQNEN